jgi:hypothetical protein
METWEGPILQPTTRTTKYYAILVRRLLPRSVSVTAGISISWSSLQFSYFRISYLHIWLGRASLDQPSFTMLTPHQWISGFTALPPIYNRLTTVAAQNGAYWAPQVIGGTGFIVSGTLFMLETQQKWYLPAPKVLGWHIGVWNLIGVRSYTLGHLFTC